MPPGGQLSGLLSANLDGSNPQGVPGAPGDFSALAADGTYLYFASGTGSAIARMNPDSSALNSSFIHVPTPSCNSNGPTGAEVGAIATDGSHIFRTDIRNGTIGRANIDGSAPDDQFLKVYNPCGTGGFGLNQGPGGVAVAGGHVYWTDTDDGKIGRANAADGTGTTPAFISGADYPMNIAATASEIYWTNNPIIGGGWTIGHAHLDSTGAVVPGTVNQSFIGGVGDNAAIAVFGGYLYFDDNDGWIGRSSLDGTSVSRHFLRASTSGGGLGGPIAVDARQSSPTTASVACGKPLVDVIERPVDGNIVNEVPGTICRFVVRDSASAARPVYGPVQFKQSPIEGVWDTSKGPIDASSASCGVTPSSTPGVSTCQIGYHTFPDANGFVRGAKQVTFTYAYAGEPAHGPSRVSSFTLPLRIVHVCDEGHVSGSYVVCDAHDVVVNGASNQLDIPFAPARSKTVSFHPFAVATLSVPRCSLSGRRQSVKLAFASTTFSPVVISHAVIGFVHGSSVSAKRNPYSVRLRFPSGPRHSRVTIVARMFVTAPHRVVKTIRWAIRLC